jgi:uncharacterized protein (DUF488 family)
MSDPSREVLTIGHSTHPIAVFLALLQAHAIELVVDVRSFPGSRRHPQFNKDVLARALGDSGIGYYHMGSLGGRRKELPHGNDLSYAEYATTAEFRAAVEALEELAGQNRIAIMCAEANWRQCHRAVIASALVADGVRVTHILPPSLAASSDLAPELPGL